MCTLIQSSHRVLCLFFSVTSVQFERSSYMVSENEGSIDIVVVLTTPSSAQVLVNIETEDDTAEG